MSVDRYGISVPQDLRGVATQPLEVGHCDGLSGQDRALATAAAPLIARFSYELKYVVWAYSSGACMLPCASRQTPETHGVQKHDSFSALQEYVQARLLQFVGEPMFAKRMYQTAEGVQRAAREVLTKLSIPAGKSLPDGAAGAYTLLFRHECRSVQGLHVDFPDCLAK